MKLASIEINNYRSISKLEIPFDKMTDDSCAYGLIGVNEAGKSSILKSIALKDGLTNSSGDDLPVKKDFKSRSPISIDYIYLLDIGDVKAIMDSVQEHNELETDDDKKFVIQTTGLTHLIHNVTYEYESSNVAVSRYFIDGYEDAMIDEIVKKIFEEKVSSSIFWTAEDRYLISEPISLNEFASSPSKVSIPLKNCFILSGITNIKEQIENLIGDSAEVEYLENTLGEAVTNHISSCWPEHPINITFSITDGFINFHVNDVGVKSKAKTADQRSDGFKQFISFLLTISVQSKNGQLENSILLLDEPETHLHPKAQENLLKEIIKITQGNRNNVALFATHSNYMIDRSDLSRNYKIYKKGDITEKERFDKKTSTHASISYEVFDVVSSDYHSELYSTLHTRYEDADQADNNRERVKNFDDNFFLAEKGQKPIKPWKGNPKSCSLPTYIRNCINHPNNGDTYTETEMRESIILMRSFI